MKIMQSFTLHQSFFALILLFAIYGCSTTNNTTATKASGSNLKPDITQADTEEAATDKQSELNKKREDIEKIYQRLGGFTTGHGRGPEHTPEGKSVTSTKKSTENSAAKFEEIENRLFVELERKLYGNWINKKETESYEFHDDGTVLINVIGERDRSYKLNGNYILVGEDRIKIDFRGDSFAGQMPARYFKIIISENEFALIDEPKAPGEPDGNIDKYKRVE